MRILFVMLHPGYIRNYESTIRLLAEKGHEVHLCFNIFKKDNEWGKELFSENSNIIFHSIPLPNRKAHWELLAKFIRGGVDYLRFLSPRYANAHKLRARIEKRFGSIIYRNTFQYFVSIFGIDLLKKFLMKIEMAIPPDRVINDFLKSMKCDIVLITPLVNFASVQKDYLKSAKFLGIPVGLCIASWDNLTNKGLIQIEPDMVFVWNEIQKSEAVELHGIPPSKVFVTGAQCYDKWYEQKPSSSRSEFCQKVGLQHTTQYLLYVCSSPFISPYEVAFVEEWIKKIRNSIENSIRNIGILIRPHPQNARQWKNVDFSHLNNVVIYPHKGANPVDKNSKADFYDSIYHSIAVVGINTSALIEAGILEKPVFTILHKNFKDTQEGTLHFHYLVKGGLLYVSKDLDEHVDQLSKVLSGDISYKEKVKIFIANFVRPYGLSIPCTPIFVKAVEDLGKISLISKSNSIAKTSRLLNLLRLFLIPTGFLLLFIKWMEKIIFKTKEEFKKQATVTKVNKFLKAGLRKCIKVICNFIMPFAKYLRNNSCMKRYIIPWLISEEIGTILYSSEITEINKNIKNISMSKKPIIVGPWLSEIGFEILYWIPFLNWAIKNYGIAKERIFVISRGGAEQWYRDICEKYVDIFDYISSEEFKNKNQKRIAATGGQKHNSISDLDMDIIQLVKRYFNIENFEWLHPSLMYNLFKYYWRKRYPIRLIEAHTSYKRFQMPQREILKDLPKKYVAVKFYFSECFPDTPENKLFILDTLQILARKSHVVLLSTGLDIDDHKDYETRELDHIYVIKKFLNPRNNLAIQTQIIAHSSAFFGTYGGFSYIAPFYGIPSVAFYSREDKFLQIHLDVAYRAFRALKYGSFDKITKSDDSKFATNGRPEFMAINVKNIDVLQMLYKADNLEYDTELQRFK